MSAQLPKFNLEDRSIPIRTQLARAARNDHAFQRALSRAKIRQLTNFYETAEPTAVDTQQ